MLVMRVPQVTCPNCGTTINLENRKEIDLDMIRNAARRQPKTFTELLHITKLSRKTLSLRLKELCESGMLIKNEGVYKLNGVSEFGNTRRVMSNGFSKVLSDRRMRTGLMLIAFLLCSSATGYVLAMFMVPPHEVENVPPPVPIGSFTMTLGVKDVKDLYGWAVAVKFNPAKLTVRETSAGDFFEVGPSYQLWSNVFPGGLLYAGSALLEVESGEDGSGVLATIVFEYYDVNYRDYWPTLESEFLGRQTYLLNSLGQELPLVALTFTCTG